MVNYASSDLLVSNLVGLSTPWTKIVVVDNLSTHEERVRVRALADQHGWELVELPDNRGFGPGVNAGARRAAGLGCASVLLLNPDVEVTADVVEELRAAALAEPYALVSPRLVDLDGRVVFAGSSLNLVDGRIRSAVKAKAAPDPRSRPFEWLTAACLALSTELWDAVGGFDEDYFMYWEDVDFNYRCRAAGARIVLREDLQAVHDQGGTQGPRRGRAKSGLYYYYNNRNRMLFAVRYLTGPEIRRWIATTPRISYEVWLHGGRRQLLETPGRALSAARGAASGMVKSAKFLLTQRDQVAR